MRRESVAPSPCAALLAPTPHTTPSHHPLFALLSLSHHTHTGAFLLSGASLTSNFTCRATWTSSEFIKGYSLTVTPVDVESKTCLTDKKLAAHNQYTCALSLIKGSTNLTAGEAFVQAFVLNGAESRGAGALATALLAALFVAASLY